MVTHSKNSSDFKLGDFSIDEARPIKVVAIGAGYSGIVAGIRFRQRIKNLDLTIYDSLAGVGGTWFANTYPGLQCDIPSHGYLPTFEANPDWSAFYVSGEEIQCYLEKTVDKYQLRQFIKLQHRVTCARYSEKTGKWNLTIRRASKTTDSPVNPQKDASYNDWEEIHDTADILFNGAGILSRWSWPDIQGLETFSGKVVHSADWNIRQDKDFLGDKRVGVIGVGSSALQIVAALRPKVKHLVNYVRGKTWIASTFVRDRLLELSGDGTVDNYQFTDKDKEAFKDPVYYNKFRREIEGDMNLAHPATLTGNPMQVHARIEFEKSMLQKLAKKPWIASHIVPDFGVACRRLTPGPGYLEALCEDNVDFVPSPIERVTPAGIKTVDGSFQNLDIIICATGFDTSFQLGFDVIGRRGITLNDHYTPHPRTYLSVAVDGFPNMFLALGPNAGVGAGNILLIMERQVDYAVAATLKMQRERLKSIEAKSEAVDDYEHYIDSYFPRTVFGSKCRSWYKAGKEEGRVVALWPGSSTHAAMALAHPRWEDFNYEYLDGIKNRLHWLGDGNTMMDKDPDADKGWYLRTENVDYPPSKI
ncbi:hypothetical protein GALMADRAFT_234472 [Galerina marginata CBS 339.88]|uniref:FAD/NAD(P)-binding domain-containing protein n=1 Tax=Galerina marginata (strain CBS 339.88) TaxID=685588 RepID=A0A067TQS2_GALM3|nr:hypothetical protein GALMADRAFT_234472 [Galerina marginata CBS 339.88]